MRQPGSSFKPIVYATAMEEGIINSRSIIVDAPICLGNWCPQNYGRSYAGSMTATIALVKSINTVPVRLTQMLGKGDSSVGRPKIIAMAKKLGIKKPLTNTAPMPIGASEIALIELATAYGSIGAGGKGLNASAVIDVRNSQGDILWSRDRDAVLPQVMKPAVAADLAGMMVQVVENGTGKRAIVPGVQIGGKTGTTNAYKDALFLGYSGYYVTGVWFGNDDSTPTHSMTGGSLPAMTFQLVMNAAHQGLDPKPVFGQSIGAAQTAAAAAASASAPMRPQTLSKRTLQVLDAIGKAFEAIQNEKPSAGPVTEIPAPSLRQGG
jgi:penicillin-binding protein 1A